MLIGGEREMPQRIARVACQGHRYRVRQSPTSSRAEEQDRGSQVLPFGCNYRCLGEMAVTEGVESPVIASAEATFSGDVGFLYTAATTGAKSGSTARARVVGVGSEVAAGRTEVARSRRVLTRWLAFRALEQSAIGLTLGA
jgi:hypothetical protein